VISCPLLEEKAFENTPELEEFLRRFLDDEFDFIQFFTGVGVRFLLQEADRQGRRKEFVGALGRTTVVARGPKPKAALAEIGRRVDHAPTKPTSEGLLDLFSSLDVSGKRIGVQLYGAPNEEYLDGLRAMGAAVTTVHVYDYVAATDTPRVRAFIERLLEEPVDVLTFTSAPQVASLFDVAQSAGLAEQLTARLNDGVAVGVIGDIAGRAVQRRGIVPRIRPANPKMAPFVDAVALYFSAKKE